MVHHENVQITRSAAIPWGIVGVLMAQAALAHFNRVSISVAGSERLMTEFALTETELGMIYSAFLLAYTLFMLPGGWVIDRAGAVTALTLMGIGTSLFVILTGVLGLFPAAISLLTLVIVRFCAGAMSAPLHPAAAQTVAQVIPPGQRTFINGMVTGAAIIGVAVTFGVFGWMMDRFGWPTAFILSGILTLLLAMLWWTVTVPLRRTASAAPCASDRKEFNTLLRDHRILLLTISYATIGYFEYLFFYWLQHYLFKVHALSITESRWYATIPTLAMAFGMPFGGWLSDRLTSIGCSRSVIPVCGMVLSAVLVGAGLCCRHPGPAVFCFALAMAGAGACEGPFWTMATHLGGERGGLSAAIVNTGGNAGGMLAPFVTPLLSSILGWSGAISIAGGLCLSGAILWYWIDMDDHPPESATAPSAEAISTRSTQVMI